MATGKITPEIVAQLGMCWTAAQAQNWADNETKGKREYSVKEVLSSSNLDYADAMSAVARVEIIPEGKLRAFAAELAQAQVVHAIKDFGSHPQFQECLAAAASGDAERIEEASRKMHRLTRALSQSQPDNRIGILALKAIRACVHADAGEAVIGAASHSAERTGWVGGEEALQKAKDDQRSRLGKIA